MGGTGDPQRTTREDGGSGEPADDSHAADYRSVRSAKSRVWAAQVFQRRAARAGREPCRRFRGGGDDETGGFGRCRRRTSLVVALTACSAGERVDLGGDSSGNLVAAIAGEPDQLDPQKTSAYFSFEVLENVFDTLVEPDENLEMRPAFAESWDVSPDQLAWTFHLRRGVTFHDGSPFTADDVVYSYRRIIDQKLANADKLSAVTGITRTRPVDRQDHAQTADAEPAHQPRRLQGSGDRPAQKRREWPDRNASGRDRTVRVRRVRRAGTRSRLTGQPDVLGWSAEGFGCDVQVHLGALYRALGAAGRRDRLDGLDSRPTRRSHCKDDDSITLAATPSNDYWYLALNEARAPWNDVRVRQAIAYAIDRDAIVQATSYGTAVANQLAIPKGNPWYTPYDAYRHDAEKAKSLLREAGRRPQESRHAGHHRIPGDGDRGTDHRG